jgi:hypothetical protein
VPIEDALDQHIQCVEIKGLRNERATVIRDAAGLGSGAHQNYGNAGESCVTFEGLTGRMSDVMLRPGPQTALCRWMMTRVHDFTEVHDYAGLDVQSPADLGGLAQLRHGVCSGCDVSASQPEGRRQRRR